ncbi:MAG: Na/Pi symporter [Candidatus Micrarchaeota archaeon]
MFDWSILLAAASGLILFLYGMEQFSREVQRVAGGQFRSFIKNATKSPLRGTILGALVTAVAQSSTAVTIITLGLVDSGILSFTQSLSVILGAGIGSTATAQLVALNFSSFAPIFIPAGFLLSMFGGRFSFLGRPVFFFGLVFLGMSLVSQASAPLREDPETIAMISGMDSVLMLLLIGFLATNIFQSSGVSTGLVVVLAGNGILDIDQSIALILGCNIGTLTPLLSSVNLSLFAKRTAMAHLIFNLFGVLILLPFIPQFTDLIVSLGGSTAQQAANAHTLSNVIAVAILLMFIEPIGRLIERIIPGKEEEILFNTEALHGKLPEDDADALVLIDRELRHMLSNISKSMDELEYMLSAPDQHAFRRLLKREALSDFLDERVENSVVELSGRKMGKSAATKAVLIMRISNALEQTADLVMAVGYVIRDMREAGLTMSEGAVADLKAARFMLHDDVKMLRKRFPLISHADVDDMRENDAELRDRITAAYSAHLERIAAGRVHPTGAFVKCMSRMESAHSKLREIRKLCEMYEKL